MSGFFSRSTKSLPDCTGPFAVGCVDIMFASCDSLKYGSFLRLFYPTGKKSDHISSSQSEQMALWCPRKEYSLGLAKFIKMGSWLFGKLIHWTVGLYIINVFDGINDGLAGRTVLHM